jgi:uncharacterized protein (DUF433 family)
MDLPDLIVSNPDLLGGAPCYRGTRGTRGSETSP